MTVRNPSCRLAACTPSDENGPGCHPERSACPEQREGTICFSRRSVVEREIPLFARNGNKCQKELVFSLGREAHTSETRRWEKPRTSPFVHHRTPLLNGFNTKRRNLRCLKAFLLISPTLFGIYSRNDSFCVSLAIFIPMTIGAACSTGVRTHPGGPIVLPNGAKPSGSSEGRARFLPAIRVVPVLEGARPWLLPDC